MPAKNIYRWTAYERDFIAKSGGKWIVVVNYPTHLGEKRGDILSSHKTYEDAKLNAKSGQYTVRCTEWVEAR
jgi:hypothetical protein